MYDIKDSETPEDSKTFEELSRNADEETKKRITKRFRVLDGLKDEQKSLLEIAVNYDLIDEERFKNLKPVYEPIPSGIQDLTRVLTPKEQEKRLNSMPSRELTDKELEDYFKK